MKLPNVIDAGTVTALCFIFSLYVSYYIDKLFPKFDMRKSKFRIAFEATAEFFVIGMILYGARMYISHIKLPFVTTNRPEEISSLPVLVFIFMFFQKNLQTKMNYLISS